MFVDARASCPHTLYLNISSHVGSWRKVLLCVDILWPPLVFPGKAGIFALPAGHRGRVVTASDMPPDIDSERLKKLQDSYLLQTVDSEASLLYPSQMDHLYTARQGTLEGIFALEQTFHIHNLWKTSGWRAVFETHQCDCLLQCFTANVHLQHHVCCVCL